jgi:hypothetical protein
MGYNFPGYSDRGLGQVPVPVGSYIVLLNTTTAEYNNCIATDLCHVLYDYIVRSDVSRHKRCQDLLASQCLHLR